MDLKTIFKTVAPIAGTLLGTPLAGVAIAAIGEAIGMSQPTAERVASAIQSGSLSPEQLLAVRQADAALKVRLRELDLDEKRIEADAEKARLGDVQDARHVHAGDRGVFWLGIAILATFAVDVVATFLLIYAILTGGITIKDVGLVAAVFGLLGTLNGYVAANAQQVISYYFGSSKGSTDKSRSLDDAIKRFGEVEPRAV